MAGQESSTPSGDFNNRSLTILAVDDDQMEHMLLERQIGNGHKLLQAENGVEALEILRKNKGSIDVVIMDWLMPMMDGLTTVRRMKEDSDLCQIPVIMVTGSDDEKEIRDGVEAGIFFYLNKPVNKKMLWSMLVTAIREMKPGIS